MLPRPCDGKIIEPEDAKSCHRDCPRAPVRPDDGHGSHSGARGTTQVVCDRRCLSSSRGHLLFSKGESLEEGGVDGCGRGFQVLSWEELGGFRRGGGTYRKENPPRGEKIHTRSPSATRETHGRKTK